MPNKIHTEQAQEFFRRAIGGFTKGIITEEELNARILEIGYTQEELDAALTNGQLP